MKIGITERGDPSIDYSWKEKIDKMDGCVIITKNLTDKLIQETKPYWNKTVFHITCTGYGGTVVEPNIPKFEEQIGQACKLVDEGFPKSKIVIRVDPIIPTIKGIRRAQNVLIKAAECGFRRFRISLIDMYPHVKERFKENNLPLPYEGNFAPSTDDCLQIDRTIKLFKELFPDAVVEACAEGELKNAEQCGCISHKEFELLNLNMNEIDHLGYQRKGCLCCSAKTELLSEKKRCPYKCLYCYWKN